MKIRRFNIKDQGQVKKLITGILANDFAMDQKAYPHSDLDSISKVYGGAREVFFVGENEGHIIGTVAVKEESGDIAILRRLFVSPKYRGKGYGRLLIGKALDFCRGKGYHEVIFHASNAMKAAMGLCRIKGFKEKEKLELGGVNIIKFTLTI
ncbi:MAG: GNAT family N-acetyltransferase [Candidatus Omnitrophota bacterium]|nr:GNAT family N-acetyltransferase [Candidatus Omnitrophota bacterium]